MFEELVEKIPPDNRSQPHVTPYGGIIGMPETRDGKASKHSTDANFRPKNSTNNA